MFINFIRNTTPATRRLTLQERVAVQAQANKAARESRIRNAPNQPKPPQSCSGCPNLKLEGDKNENPILTCKVRKDLGETATTAHLKDLIYERIPSPFGKSQLSAREAKRWSHRDHLNSAPQSCPIAAEVVAALSASPRPKEVRIIPPEPIQGSE